MLTRSTVILAKVETTYGTDAVPTAAANALLVKDVNLKVNGETIKRDFVRSSFSPLQFVRGMKDAEVSFKTELKGTGTRGVKPAYGWEGDLLQGCGMGETVVASTSITYAPISTGFKSVTLYVYKDGIFHKITGARGSFKLNLEAGKYGVVEWNFKGLYNTPVDATPTAQTFSGVVPPSFLSAAATVGGYSPIFEKIDIDMANSFSTRKNANSASGITEQVITGREPKGSFDPMTVTEATHAFWGNWSSGAAIALNVGPLGGTSGNTIQITAPKMQYQDITYGDKSGDLSYNIPFALNMNTGDDELSIVFT